MHLLTINAGSSSLRLALFKKDGEHLHVMARQHYAIDGGRYRQRLEEFLGRLGSCAIDAVGHRIVHGGPTLTMPTLIGDQVESAIADMIPLAPLHNPPALECLNAAREILGRQTPQIAVFDTGFYIDLPEAARTYALPRRLCQRHGIRRYGFHGIAHQAMWRRWCALSPQQPDGGRIITFQLGAGCSITAIDHGRPVETSMGMSPLEGLVMASRCGDVDPGILTMLQRTEGFTPDEIERILYEESGIRGISELSADMRELLDSDRPEAALAVAVFIHRARKYLGAYLAVLGGADAVIFGGGIGEHAWSLRQEILSGLTWAGIDVDAAANRALIGREGIISTTASTTRVLVTVVDEAHILAEETAKVLAHSPY